MMPLMKNQKERTDDAINEHTVTRVDALHCWLHKHLFLNFLSYSLTFIYDIKD